MNIINDTGLLEPIWTTGYLELTDECSWTFQAQLSSRKYNVYVYV
jgi:hypothetical protein